MLQINELACFMATNDLQKICICVMKYPLRYLIYYISPKTDIPIWLFFSIVFKIKFPENVDDSEFWFNYLISLLTVNCQEFW